MLLIRIVSYIVAAVKYKSFASLHTALNKLTGLLVFLLPYFMAQAFIMVYGWITAIVAGIASMEELVIHLSGRGYHPDRTGIWKQTNKQEENEP